MDSHGPDLSFFCPALVFVCARAGSGYVEVAAEPILHSIETMLDPATACVTAMGT